MWPLPFELTCFILETACANPETPFRDKWAWLNVCLAWRAIVLHVRCWRMRIWLSELDTLIQGVGPELSPEHAFRVQWSRDDCFSVGEVLMRVGKWIGDFLTTRDVFQLSEIPPKGFSHKLETLTLHNAQSSRMGWHLSSILSDLAGVVHLTIFYDKKGIIGLPLLDMVDALPALRTLRTNMTLFYAPLPMICRLDALDYEANVGNFDSLKKFFRMQGRIKTLCMNHSTSFIDWDQFLPTDLPKSLEVLACKGITVNRSITFAPYLPLLRELHVGIGCTHRMEVPHEFWTRLPLTLEVLRLHTPWMNQDHYHALESFWKRPTTRCLGFCTEDETMRNVFGKTATMTCKIHPHSLYSFEAKRLGFNYSSLFPHVCHKDCQLE